MLKQIARVSVKAVKATALKQSISDRRSKIKKKIIFANICIFVLKIFTNKNIFFLFK